MKDFRNLIGVTAFMSLLLVFACTNKTSVEDYVPVDDTEMAVDELVALSGTGAGGDSIRKPKGGFGDRGNGRFDHPGKSKGDSITVAQLPQAARNYLSTNKLVDSVKSVAKVTMPDGSVRYVVNLKSHKHLHFDANGALLPTPNREHAFTAITYNDLPAAAKTYLTANADITKITNVVKITGPDGKVRYGVRLSDNKHFMFDAAGALLGKRG